MLNDHDGDWPWLSYHALIHHHDVPDGDFLRTCMEEVEHNLAKACPLVTQSVDEYLERVLKVVVFSWTCSLFSVETLRDTDLAHIYNVSPEDMQNLTQALDANRKAIHGAVVLRLVPRIVRYSAEDKAGPSSETAQERDARRLYAQVAAERDARRLYAQVAAKDDIENQPATIASDRKSDTSDRVTSPASRKAKQRPGRKQSTLRAPKPTGPQVQPKTPKQRIQPKRLAGSRIANTASQPDTPHERKYRASRHTCTITTARLRESAALLAQTAYPTTSPYSGSRTSLNRFWQAVLAPAPPSSPSIAISGGHAESFSRTRDMPQAAGDGHDGIRANPANEVCTVPSPTSKSASVVRVMHVDAPAAAATSAQEDDASPPMHTGDGRRQNEVEAAQEASALLPLLPALRRSPEDNLPTNISSPTDRPHSGRDGSRPEHPQSPAESRPSDAPKNSQVGSPKHTSVPTILPSSHSPRGFEAGAPISRSSSSDSVERRLAVTDDGVSAACALPDAPTSALHSSGPLSDHGSSSLPEPTNTAGPLICPESVPSKRSAPDVAAQPLPPPHAIVQLPPPPSHPAPIPAAKYHGTAQQSRPSIGPSSYPFSHPLVPLPPARPQPASRPLQRAPAPYTSVPRPLPRAPEPTPPAPTPAPLLLHDLLTRLDSIADVELRLRVWALDTALRFLANFEHTFPPTYAAPPHAFRPGARAYADAGRDPDVQAYCRQMRAALLGDVRRAEGAVLEYLRVREAVGRGAAACVVAVPAERA
ncbi:hypothetical protein PsYK624_028470 [Phanerochaete sordida]|uniref:Uncharacterized protein n=1 Tax=Phanerochaete sordida TaxID=48140 RepID=A0A9P3G1Y3_9APHY|nr:hypothetical protein PsYK624_028470 [Phanerochaete sordida]